jgi:predicted short-subunit dehydrogenase-like oxidoreductase (DUF2520 family)
MTDKIFIIGCGAVGTSLGKALKDAGNNVIGIYDTDPLNARNAATIIGTEAFGGALPSRIRDADMVLLTVTDSAIESVAEQAKGEELYSATQVWVHCSGRLTSAALEPLCPFVAGTGSMHPAWAFPPKTLTPIPPGVYFAVEGQRAGTEVMAQRIQELHGNAVFVPPEARTAYHAAMVMASNYMVVLLASAHGLLKGIGVDPEQIDPMLLSLSESAIFRARRLGIGASLSGPIRRGDMGVVEDHVRALADSPYEKALYIAAGKAAVKLAATQPGYCPDTAVTLSELLDRLAYEHWSRMPPKPSAD